MGLLKEKEEIEDYDLKVKILQDNGWVQLWHVDNWVRQEWFGHPTLDIDRAGVSTDSAYCQYEEKEDLPIVYKVVTKNENTSIQS